MSDEFSVLPGTARDLGFDGPLPSVRRAGADTPDGHVSALIWGDGPRFTFLHGAALNAHTWDSTVLSLGHPSLVLDLPGHGDSAWRDDFDYAPRTIAPAVTTTIDTLAAGKPQILVGQSLGGLTAIAVAELRPDLVNALILVDVSPVTVPILLVRATNGYLPDEVVAEFTHRVPSAQVITVDSRHNVQENRPTELAALIKLFTA